MNSKRTIDLNELKAAILYAEKEVRNFEKAEKHLKATWTDETFRTFVWEAECMRIAAACMWEKLERMEAGKC